ncbi:type 1 glutamine amidotransferase [Pseudoroseicyclus sp. H15]
MLIGILQTGHAPDALRPALGDYSDLFERLLGGQGFEFAVFSVVDGEFPPGPEAADGWLITGSKHGAYEDHAWIPPLEELIRAIRDSGRPLVGICFGHQIIAQALGGKVEKFPGGWAVGRTLYDLGGETLALNAWHQDQVTVAPEGAEVVATNAFCANAALAYGDQIFTVQAHPEFNSSFIEGLIDKRGKGVVPDHLLSQARAALPMPNDNDKLAEKIANVLRAKVTA